eukprot:TRINITY_DN2814_c0_g1_i2.p2 TRINITY_DN2814_c0_g1~~TRINITY_DN2814_c0_g1_i2.p2  ORF type:complete len:454 (-),score=91.18 TRINITY_DN2814_c0_g1_i2:1854-3215(-)
MIPLLHLGWSVLIRKWYFPEEKIPSHIRNFSIRTDLNTIQILTDTRKMSRLLFLLVISISFELSIGKEENIFVEEKGGIDVFGCGGEKNPCLSLPFAFQNTSFESLTSNDTLRFRLSGQFVDYRTLNANLDVSSRKDFHGVRFWIGPKENSTLHFHCDTHRGCQMKVVGSNQSETSFTFKSLSMNRVSISSKSSELYIINSNFANSARPSMLNSSNCGFPFIDFASSSSSSLYISQSTFSFSCSNSSGGALRIQIEGKKEEKIVIQSSQFNNNKSTKDGGVLFLSSQSASWMSLTVHNCKFLNNSALNYGGAIAFDNELIGNWSSNAIFFNEAKNYDETNEIACLGSDNEKKCGNCRTDYCHLCDGLGICATSITNEIQYCYVKVGDEMECGGSSHKEIAYIGGILGGIFVISIGLVLLLSWANIRKQEYITLNDEPPWTTKHDSVIAPKSFD